MATFSRRALLEPLKPQTRPAPATFHAKRESHRSIGSTAPKSCHACAWMSLADILWNTRPVRKERWEETPGIYA
jgi:hypothetical protein